MTLVKVFISLIWLAIANAQLDSVVKLDPPISITPVDHLRSHFLQPDYVVGSRDCGGPGRILQFTHTNCAPALPAVACIGQVGKVSTGEWYFVAGQDATDLLVRGSVITSDGKLKSDDLPVPDITLRAGQSYMMRAVGVFEEELQGKLFTGRVEVIKKSDSSVQACSEIDFIGYKP